ncbi:hypothetical protein [Paenibacillus thalictri]|nr:hypothetical protein [Paenibacillus thalictri]
MPRRKKTVARVHEIHSQLLEAMWNQHQNNSAATRRPRPLAGTAFI